VAALVRKTEILWHLVDCVELATGRDARIGTAAGPATCGPAA
jgi:hypothetical protein